MSYLSERKQLMKNILIIAMPAIMEMALNTMLMVADTAMIGQIIGKEAISAVGIVNSIFFLLIFVFSSFNTGAVALISRSYGQQDLEKSEKIAGNNITINLLIGILISIMAFSLKDLLFMPYDITEEVLANVKSYYSIIVFGMVFQFGSFALASTSRGVEDTRTPMYITGFANIFNIVFNYLLIKGIAFFPEMGIQGAALATTLARLCAFLIYLYVFTSGNHRITLHAGMLKINKAITKQLWKISYPGAIEQLLMQGSFFLMGIIITLLDTTSEALFRILITIESTSFMPAVGISIATATLVGKSLGEKDIPKATDTGYIATGMGALWGILAGILFYLFPELLMSLFTDEPSVIDAGRQVFLVMAINQIFLNTYIVMSGALRGAGDTNAVMIITSLRLWTIFVPMSYLLINFTDSGVSSVWFAEITSFFIYLLFLLGRFHSKKWTKLNIE